MRRLQLYLTDEEREAVASRASDQGISQAEVVRRILDGGLGLKKDQDDRLAAVRETAGVAPDRPDWREWLTSVRGAGAGARLKDLQP
jgi:hypothetical protein